MRITAARLKWEQPRSKQALVPALSVQPDVCILFPFLFAGLEAELAYVRDGRVSDVAQHFTVPVPATINELCFVWVNHEPKTVSRADLLLEPSFFLPSYILELSGEVLDLLEGRAVAEHFRARPGAAHGADLLRLAALPALGTALGTAPGPAPGLFFDLRRRCHEDHVHCAQRHLPQRPHAEGVRPRYHPFYRFFFQFSCNGCFLGGPQC